LQDPFFLDPIKKAQSINMAARSLTPAQLFENSLLERITSITGQEVQFDIVLLRPSANQTIVTVHLGDDPVGHPIGTTLSYAEVEKLISGRDGTRIQGWIFHAPAKPIRLNSAANQVIFNCYLVRAPVPGDAKAAVPAHLGCVRNPDVVAERKRSMRILDEAKNAAAARQLAAHYADLDRIAAADHRVAIAAAGGAGAIDAEHRARAELKNAAAARQLAAYYAEQDRIAAADHRVAIAAAGGAGAIDAEHRARAELRNLKERQDAERDARAIREAQKDLDVAWRRQQELVARLKREEDHRLAERVQADNARQLWQGHQAGAGFSLLDRPDVRANIARVFEL
jgi:hypothetical protein